MAISIFKDAMNNEDKSLSCILTGLLKKMGEMVWFFLSMILFVVLGPFSAPIALLALLQLGYEDHNQISPKSVA